MRTKAERKVTKTEAKNRVIELESENRIWLQLVSIASNHIKSNDEQIKHIKKGLKKGKPLYRMA